MPELIFVVNPASGGRLGGGLMTRLRAVRPNREVIDLSGADLPALAGRAQAAGQALIACGGDGTVAALFEAAWQAHLARPALAPPAVGVIPLGTGNDLARSLGWGGKPPRSPRLEDLIRRLEQGAPRRYDRWLIDGAAWRRPWFNYWSIGIDARIAGRFHAFRHRHPRICRSPLANRLLYAALGGGEPGNPLRGWADAGVDLRLPTWASALVIASIPSYAGGVRLSPRIVADDGLVDVFALAHGVALGLATGGLRRPRELGRVPVMELRLARPAAMQIDGEPFVAPAGRYRLRRDGQVVGLAPASAASAGSV